MQVASKTRATARFAFTTLAAAAVIALAPLAHAGVPFPTRNTPAAVDLGQISAQHAPISVSVVLKQRNTDELEALIASQHTVGDPLYRQFLTPAQFQQRFGPGADTVAAAVAYFQKAGLATKVTGSVLTVTGSTAAVQSAFGVKLHEFEVAAHAGADTYRFHAPAGSYTIGSAAVAQSVVGVVGLDSRPVYRPMSHQLPAALRNAHAAPAAAPGTPDAPGLWTVTDLAQYYNVTPLYAAGVTGAGKTIGIVTLAAFTPTDAFSYWANLGLTVDPNRLTVVNIDGGPGAPNDAAGSAETTLDVEQSGGIATGAKIIVYQAPNTDQGFVDAFAKAIDDNLVDSFSVSWGEWEYYETQDKVSPPGGGRRQTPLDAFNTLFKQAASQGQSAFSASGDSGAYEPNNPAISPVPAYSKTLGVNSPSSSPYITAAGGTTLPGLQVFNGPTGPYPINIKTEQAWGYDYLTGLCAALGYDVVSCGIFPGGSGGGVSSYFAIPRYQSGVAGMQVTEAGQVFIDETTTPPTTIFTLPSGFAGRNMPDVSLNADPDTGYIILYTSSTSGLETLTYYGGTSFVAPQLNGVAALLDQSAGGRVGLWNTQMYKLSQKKTGYAGASAPFRDMTAGDNWFYSAVPGYDDATGVGVLNVANFVKAMTP